MEPKQTFQSDWRGGNVLARVIELHDEDQSVQGSATEQLTEGGGLPEQEPGKIEPINWWKRKEERNIRSDWLVQSIVEHTQRR